VRARLLIKCVPAGEQRAILPGMTLRRRDLAGADVMVLVAGCITGRSPPFMIDGLV